MRVLIAIPVYNERKYVAQVLARVKRYHDEILFVDDCSTDGTGEFLATQPGIRLVRHAQNMGYGRSIIDAFDYAAIHGFDWVITMDCDEQHEPEMIPAFLREIAKDDADIISGSRYTDQSLQDDLAPGDRRLINQIITTVTNDLFCWQLTDTFCGFKAHRVSAMQTLKLDEAGYAFPLQLWPRVWEHGLVVRELAVKRIYNDPTRTFGAALDDANRRLKHYLSVLKRELVRMNHPSSACVDQVSLDDARACCGCECS